MKKKWIALLMCFFAGFCGAHQYYVRNYNRAIFYGVFFFTGIPWVVSIFDFWILVFTSKKKFHKKYNTVIYGTGTKEGLNRYLNNL